MDLRALVETCKRMQTLSVVTLVSTAFTSSYVEGRFNFSIAVLHAPIESRGICTWPPGRACIPGLVCRSW